MSTSKLAQVFCYLILWMGIISCVQLVDFEIPQSQLPLVVDGLIYDGAGPQEVRLSSGLDLNADSINNQPVTGALIHLHDDLGKNYDFTEVNPGVYHTDSSVSGIVGRSYWIIIETAEGKKFESDPELLHPVGEIDSIRYEFEERLVRRAYSLSREDVFNVFVDARQSTETANSFVRWRFNGTYEAATNPELHLIVSTSYLPYKSPWPCSGYILVTGPIGSGGLLEKVGECECCTCWPRQYETKPQISDGSLVLDGQFKNVKVGEVPITNATFHSKYLVEVEQMSMTSTAYDYFELIRRQKETTASLFQPAPAEIRGNIRALNNSDPVVGLFWATSISKKAIFIYPEDVPYPLPPLDFLTLPCAEIYPNATYQKPLLWE